MMTKARFVFFLIFFQFFYAFSYCRDYDVTGFGAINDGITLNTNIIQAAIDYINENGGGRLVFDSGVYITGTIYIKSGVILHLQKNAELRGSGNPFHYWDKYFEWTAVILAVKQQNVGITGEGTINAMGYDNANNLVELIHKRVVNDALTYDRPVARRTSNIVFGECENVIVRGITLRDPSGWTLVANQCRNMMIDSIRINSTAYWNNDGIDIVDCDGVDIRNSLINASDDALCFKSHDATKICQNVTVENCVVRSSASGLKFGTVSRGGFKNFKVTNLKVHDTYRSAITIQAVDGGLVENIIIDGVEAKNVGNAIFLRIGDRWSSGKTPSLEKVQIKNVYAEVSLSKPDSGYRYEGPVEDLPRNISPASIIGLPDWRIKDIVLENIEINYPGGGNPHYAKRQTTAEGLEAIPEMPYAYPEFSQFKELPAWGFYVRHADGITFENVSLKARSADYRPAMVFDDTRDVKLGNIKINEVNSGRKNEIILNNSVKRK